jgi:hypothetical protein
MDLPTTICTQARTLPVELQREALDFISYLGQRYNISPHSVGALSTAAFIKRFAGCIGDDFPNDVSTADLPNDSQRESFE